MECLAEKIGLRFQRQHPLWSWACRHAAWTLNRYQVLRGTTSFELTHGKAYDGKMCPFGEVVFAYSKQKQGFKADPKWKVGICLGKTEVQDAWVIGDGNRVFLSKSIRRVADASAMLSRLHGILLGIPTELWRPHRPIQGGSNHGGRSLVRSSFARDRRSCST